MRQYPQFLKTNPVFNGLALTDIGSIMGVLYLSMIFRFHSLVTVGLCGVAVLISKFLTKNFDLIGFILPRHKSLELQDVDCGTNGEKR
jgi:predicted Co/Zn/Cd cation transporter (cation efflux family)